MPYINEVLATNEAKNAEAKLNVKSERVSRFHFDPEAIATMLEERIVGQPDMQNAISDLLHLVKADFGRESKPLGVQLFVGPTGVGKTETVRLIAEAIHGSADHLCRIDMNTLAQEHYVAAITGAPPGYVGSKENHSLFDTDRIEGSYSKPGIVLFDEIEKASDEVIRALLNLLDTGKLELSAGTKQLNFTNCLIFMTSNIGARTLAKYQNQFNGSWRKRLGMKPLVRKTRAILDQALHQKFDPEFINRIDQIVPFQQLEESWLDTLLSIEVTKLNQRLRKKQVTLVLETSARSCLLNKYDKRFGARDLIRNTRTLLEPALARAINQYPDHSNLVAKAINDQIAIECRG
ncbi:MULTISPECIES: AAA family ATPase [unclassified Lentimonas]|uniref:AAA family ATPase n=1 Tax=unclassified Lentimonas TaxID=2630993 RepID=UPI001329315D|nr:MULTISPECIES: AAA family ATPase [unclassified Lentimonas]CAA6689487.1 ClpB protein [Lentimonas sp. CC19]CAA6692509.1 ClpB protein [Lentimonas sp. CC10]CAA7069148.1 ClpB protein [Lentimonas sp. CC11]